MTHLNSAVHAALIFFFCDWRYFHTQEILPHLSIHIDFKYRGSALPSLHLLDVKSLFKKINWTIEFGIEKLLSFNWRKEKEHLRLGQNSNFCFKSPGYVSLIVLLTFNFDIGYKCQTGKYFCNSKYHGCVEYEWVLPSVYFNFIWYTKQFDKYMLTLRKHKHTYAEEENYLLILYTIRFYSWAPKMR